MAVVERVIIKVEVDADISNDLANIERRLKALEDRTRDLNRRNRDLDRTTGRVNRQMDKMDRNSEKVTKRFDKMGRAIRGVTQVFTKFVTMLSKFSFIALAGQIGLFTAGLLAAKAALITGRASVSAYQASLRGLSVAAAGVATAMAVAAAAIREFQEAQLIPFLGGGSGGRARAVGLNRGLSAQTSGLLGGEATSAITGAFARGGVRGPQANQLARQLFNLSGGDAKAAQALASAIGSGDVNQARTAIRGASGFRAESLANVTTMGGLISTVAGGGATSDAFSGVAETLAGTMIGTLKTEFAGLKGIFADIGDQLLAPFRDAFLEISRILREDVIAMTAVLQQFGADSFAPTLVTTIDKISEFIRSNVIENMDNVERMGKSFVNFFKGVRDFFEAIGGYLSRLEPAADVVIEMFRAMGNAGGGRGLFQQFNKLIVDNADAFVRFGSSIGNVFGALFDQLSGGQMGFFNKLPLLSEILDRLAFEAIPALFNVFNKFAPLMEQLPDALTGLANVLDMLAPIIESLVSVVSGLMNAIGFLTGDSGIGEFAMAALMYGGFKKFTGGMGATRAATKAAAKAGGTFVPNAAAASASAAAATSSTFVSGSALTGTARLRNAFSAGRMYGAGGYSPGMRAGFSAARTAGGRMVAARAGTMVGGKLIPGISAVLSAKSLYDHVGLSGFGIGKGGTAYQTGKFTGSGTLSGAMLGASIGSVIPVVGTVAGAIIGAAAGTALELVAAYRGKKELKNKSKAAVEKLMDGLTGTTLEGMGAEAFNEGQSIMEKYNAALESAIDPDTGEFTGDGDTRAFRDFLRAVGVDPNAVHRDEAMKLLLEEDYGSALESQLQDAVDFMEDQINNIADALGMGAEEIAASLEALGIDAFTNFNDTAAAGLIALLNSPFMDRSSLVLPDFSTSTAGKRELLESANAAYNTLISETTAGEFNTGTISDFVDRFAAAEIANGMAADVAGLSGLKEIREGVAVGELPASVLEQFGVVDQERLIFNELEQRYGLGLGGAESLYRAYSEGGFSIQRVSEEIQRRSDQRETLRAGLIGGDVGALAEIAGPEAIEQLIGGIGVSGLGGGFKGALNFTKLLAMGGSGDYEGATKLLDENYEGGAKQATIDFMIQSGDLQGAQVGILEQIRDNTGNPVAFNITGEVSETNLTARQIVLTIESLPAE